MVKKPIYIDYDTCKKCQGECCQRMPGMCIPEDFKKLTIKSVVKLLSSGKYAIDWWENDPREDKEEFARVYYVRGRHVGERAINGSWGGVCVNWSLKSGCSLKDNERPFQCRMLKPQSYTFGDKHHNCGIPSEDKGTKKELAVRWIPFQATINKAINIYQG